MKKKIVLALITATMVGALLTGCGGKTTTDTATETTQNIEDTSNVYESSEETVEDVEAVETVKESTDENTTDSVESTSEETEINEESSDSTQDTEEIDESTILDSEIPDDPEEVVAIIKSIKDYDIRCEYALKANDKFDGNDEARLKWADLIYPYWENILEKTDIEE